MAGEYRLTRYEMETTINFNAEEGTAVLYTRDKAVMRRLDKLVEEFPEIYKCIRETGIDKTYEFPKKYAIPKRPRIMSEEQRAKLAVRLANARAKQGADGDTELPEDEDDLLDDDTEDTEDVL